MRISKLKKKILKAMLDGDKLTHLDASRRFGTNRLAHYIQEMRKDNVDIKSKPVGDSRYFVYWVDT